MVNENIDIDQTDVVERPMVLSDLFSTPGVVDQQVDQQVNEESHLVLVSHDESKLCYLVEEAGNRGVLDSGCSKSVTGVGWIANYTNAISAEFAQQLALSQEFRGVSIRRWGETCVKRYRQFAYIDW